jgi:hypothetical protein
MTIDVMYAGIIVIIIVLLSYAYVSSDHYYKIILKKAFDELDQGSEIRRLNPEMKWEMVNMNIDGYINNKKIVFNHPFGGQKNPQSYKTFTNKNTLAAILNNVVVFDIDSNEPIIIDDEPIQRRLPKTTVTAKTPHGYHYYFYNDTGSPISCRVGLKLNNVKYPVDLLSGPKQLIFLPPTRIESACYRWINSPFTHRIEPISKHTHLLDLFAYTKEFAIPPEPVNACMSKTIPNMLCIVWEFQIIYQLRNKCTSSLFELLHSNKHELLYRTTPNSTYYLFLKHAPLKQYNANKFVQHVADLIRRHSITGGIVHLGCGISHKNYGNSNIVQFNSCRVHNHAKHGLPIALVRAEQTLVQTSVFTHRPVSIISSDIVHESVLSQDETSDNDNDNDTLVNEDLFLIFIISNQTRIPCACLMQITSFNETKDEVKYTKLIQYFMRNALNATHHINHPRNMLPFFSEVPMIRDTMLD